MQEAMQSHFSVFRRGDTLQQVIVSYVGWVSIAIMAHPSPLDRV
jgi:hypothetical protein